MRHCFSENQVLCCVTFCCAYGYVMLAVCARCALAPLLVCCGYAPRTCTPSFGACLLSWRLLWCDAMRLHGRMHVCWASVDGDADGHGDIAIRPCGDVARSYWIGSEYMMLCVWPEAANQIHQMTKQPIKQPISFAIPLMC